MNQASCKRLISTDESAFMTEICLNGIFVFTLVCVESPFKIIGQESRQAANLIVFVGNTTPDSSTYPRMTSQVLWSLYEKSIKTAFSAMFIQTRITPDIHVFCTIILSCLQMCTISKWSAKLNFRWTSVVAGIWRPVSSPTTENYEDASS